MKATLPTLVHLFRARAEEDPHRVALSLWDARARLKSRLTMLEWFEGAQSTAAGLCEHVQAGDRVLIMFPNGLEWAVAFFACLLRGAIPVPVTPPLPNSDLSLLRSVLQDAEPSAWFGSLPSALQQETSMRPVFLETQARQVDFELPSGGQLAYLQYTSGSVSRPRGVRVNHEHVCANLSAIGTALPMPERERLVSWLPLAHDMGLVSKLLFSLGGQHELLLLSPLSFLKNPLSWLQLISDSGAVASGAPNFAFDLCCERVSDEQARGLDLSAWRYVMMGAEPVRSRTVERFCRLFGASGLRPAAVTPGYGLAEATLYVSRSQRSGPVQTWTAPSGQELVSCGPPDPCLSLCLLDPVSGAPVEGEKGGEICLEGPSVTRGYWNQPPRAGWLHTGDFGYLRRGELYVGGRLKATLNVRGRKFQAEDLEDVTVQALGLRSGSCCLFQVADGSIVLAVESRAALLPQQEAELRALLAGRGVELHRLLWLPAGSLPRTNSGKIQRGRCQALFAGSQVQGDKQPEPRLCAYLSGRGELPEGEAERPFDSFGLSSLDKLALIARLEAETGWSLAPDLPWVHPTPRQLRDALQTQHRPGWLPLRSGQDPPLFLMPSLHRTSLWAAELARHWPGPQRLLGGRIDHVQVVGIPELAVRLASDLQTEWPGGPVRLLGYSYGCKLAFEVAQVLHSRGRQVDFIGLIDGWPHLPYSACWWDDCRAVLPLIPWSFRQWRRGKHQSVAREWLGLLRLLHGRLLRGRKPRTGSAPVSADVAALVQASLQYRPGWVPLKVVLLRRSQDRHGPLFLSETAWAAHAASVDVVEVPGNHSDLIHARAGDLARALAKLQPLSAPSASPLSK